MIDVDNFATVIVPCTLTLAAQVLFETPIALSESEESGSSEEDEILISIINKKRKWKKPFRIENYIEVILPSLTVRQFQEHFRMSVDAYEHLLNIVGPQLLRQAPTGRPTINTERQLLSVIWLLATPDSFRSVGERFNIAKSSLSVCVVRIIKILNALAPTVIKWPDEGRRQDIKRRFRVTAGLNNVIGVVDGTYIPIKAPKIDPQSYVTRKCNYAFTLQAIAEPLLTFTDIFIGFPGSVSDTRIFRNSDIYNLTINNVDNYFTNEEYILGDKAYPVLNWCIPPYINRGNLTRAQVHFNTTHARTRQVIERAFALLFGRFRRLKYLDMQRHDLIPATVLAACVLHNICLDFEELLQREDYIREGIPYVQHEDEHDNVANYIVNEGRARRDQICRALYHRRNNEI